MTERHVKRSGRVAKEKTGGDEPGWWTKSCRWIARKWRELAKSMQNAPLTALSGLMIMAFAVYSAAGIFQTNTAEIEVEALSIPLAAVEAVFDLGTSGLVFWGMMAAAKFAMDLRPEQRKRALPAFLLAIALATVPCSYLAKGFSIQDQFADWRGYAGSEQNKADVLYMAGNANTRAPDLEKEALDRLKLAIKPTKAEPGFQHWVKALWLHFGVMLAGYCFVLARRETPAEARSRTQAQRRAERKAEREAEQLRIEAEIAKRWRDGLPEWVPDFIVGIVKGGKYKAFEAPDALRNTG